MACFLILFIHYCKFELSTGFIQSLWNIGVGIILNYLRKGFILAYKCIGKKTKKIPSFV